MGSCYKDCRLEGESVSLGDGDGNRSLEAESEENEAKQMDLGREGFGEEIGSLNNLYCGVDIRGDCVELVRGVKKAETQSLTIMGDEEENDHLGPDKATDVCVWKKDIEGFDGYGDRNLQVEAEDNEPKQENLEKEDAMRESRHLELGKVLVEEVGGSTNINGGAEIGNDCGELVEKESGHLGLDHAVDISEFKKDFKGCKAEAHRISDMVNVLNDINGGAHCSDNESEHRILVHNAEEEGQEISRVVKENVHLRLEQPVKVSILWTDFNQCEMQPSSANGDAFDRNNAASVDGGSDIKLLIFEKKDDINSSGYTGAEKDSELIGLAQMLEVKAPEPVSAESDCLRCCSFENIDESKKSNDCYSVHTLEVEVTNNVVSVDGGSGSGKSVGGKKEAEDVCRWDSGSNEDIGHLDVEKESAFEAPKSVSEKEHDEFPGLSPLRTLSGGDFACSIFSMGSEVGLLSSGMFDGDGGRNGCEDAEILVSSGLAAGCPLLRIDGDASKKSDGQCCPHDASQNVEANCTFERSEKLCSFGDEEVNCSQLSEGDNRGRNDSKSNPIIVFRRSNPKRSASLRSNLADGKHNPSSTGSNRRKCGKAVHISPTFLLSTIKISGKVKRKRSCSHRIARPSLWGPVEDLIKIFEQNVRLANYDGDRIPDRNRRSKKVRPTVCSKRHAKSQRDGKFRVSATNHSATPDKVEVKHKWAGDNFALAVKSLRNRQLGDKDVESSLTQEVSVELGELPGVYSQIASEMLVKTASDRNSLDPGTSPDSDVYHPVIDANTTTSEFTNSAGQDIRTKDVIITSDDVSTTSGIQSSGMVQNMHVLGAVSEVGLHSVVSPSTGTSATSFCPPPDPNLCDKAKKGKKSGHLSKQTVGEKLHGPGNTKKLSNCSKSKEKKQDVINKKNRGCLKSIKKTLRKGSEDNSFPPRSYVYKTNDLECLDEYVEVQDSLEKCVLPDQDFINPDKGHKFSNGSNPGTSKGRSHCRETTRQKRRNAHGKMGKCVQNSDNRCGTEERSQTVDAFLDASDCMSFSSGAPYSTLMVSTQQNYNTAVLEDVSSLVMTSAGDLIPNESTTSPEKPLPPQVAWVLCDDCEKWRCISVELANTLEETKCKWTCKDNADKAFSDCSIPQEKTNAEINAELGIIDEEDPSSVEANTNGVKPSKLAAAQRTSWTPIKSNVFLHRSRKTQTIDEIMVCHCKPPRDGHWGCGDQCLNRMLNIECAKGTCPCGDLCSNQQFQKRKYAKFEWLRCGKKGYGLQLLEDVSQGQFLIEYVGEVLDLATYDARQREYAFQGQKHFYFMTLNGGEVIDACAKGNLGRFINHSCEPNCRTEKWMVNGEVCIGLFAIRDIKKGEEVTFDYNYVRVVGAAAKKCICGSTGCRGYLGGDPLNSEIIVQSDTDEEDIEPVIIHEKGQRELNLNDSVSHANDVMISKYKENSGEMKDNVIRHLPAIPEPEVCVQNEVGGCRDRPEVNPLDTCLQSLDPMQAEEIVSRPDAQPLGVLEQSLNSAPVKDNVCKLTSDIQPEDISLRASTTMNEGLSDSVLNNKKAVTDVYEEKPSMAKPHSFTKSSHSRGTIKRGRSSVKNIVFPKPKTFASGADSSHSEGVEEKLNELLEIDGGISKKNDATRGYLKLLFVTAAEGDVGGCASQSTRDLSLILDAILKTKSRKVLVDIINKNGLQMLHNIMKQNRGNFNRIPILRKLLKVLEFLAFTGILTPELINKDPPHSGMESFKVSILKLASHSDKQVHKIAREFRDKWIPRNIRRVEPSDRDCVQLDQQLPHHVCWTQSSKVTCQQVQAARDNDAIIIINTADHRPTSSSGLDNPGGTFSSYNSHHQQSISRPAVTNINSSASGTKPRKRKSRWDHPSDTTSADPQDQILEQAGPKFPKCTPDLHDVEDGNSSQDLMQLDGDDGRPPGFFNDDIDDDGPPGFQNNLHSQSSPSAETTSVTGEEFVMGHPQEIYLSHVTMSYGIPVVLMQQLGTLEAGENNHQFCNQNWAIAPGMPFHPFPPLPPYPRKAGQKLDTDLRLSEGGMTETSNGSRNSVFNGRRLRFPSNRGCGTRFLHPQRWDNSNNNRRRFQIRWSRGPIQRFSRGGFGGNSNIRNGVRNIRGGFRGGLCPPDGVNNNDVSSVFRQLHN